MQMVHRLESELQTKHMEADKLQVEKASNTQTIKLLEHQISKIKKAETMGGDKDSVLSKLQNEYEELKITNAVYLEKINELVDEINQTRDESDSRISELNFLLESAQKQMKENGVNFDTKSVNFHANDTMTVKSSISKNFGNSDDVVALRKEIDTLRQRIVILTDKNMEYQNVLSDYKNRDRSKSANRKK